ncbi:helix-turn-helix domain-containing protein [Streptomyces sp. NPDC058291]|uniref:helix-turn-helix domain-containing protein n=1 Tax=Streptomyces sp. NPDC058291 TaxID=3346427 RepID=UPI0036E39F70
MCANNFAADDIGRGLLVRRGEVSTAYLWRSEQVRGYAVVICTGRHVAEPTELEEGAAAFYNRLERGKLAVASDSVLNAIAQALQLDDVEREHLFDLARAGDLRALRPDGAPGPGPRSPSGRTRPGWSQPGTRRGDVAAHRRILHARAHPTPLTCGTATPPGRPVTPRAGCPGG